MKSIMDRHPEIIEMLKAWGLFSPANVTRAWMGSIDPPRAGLMVCSCGWRGREDETDERRYDSGLASWERLGGRRGWHWHCPRCDRVIWRYYNVIS